MLSKTFLHDGKLQPLPRPLELRAGPLTMIFEPATGFLRQLRLGDHEVVRAIYAAVRDQNWATVPPQIANLKSQIEKDSFRLSFDMTCRQPGVDYFWQGVITGDATGRVRYTFDGAARSDFQRNRIGLCLLHPIAECAGKPCAVEHGDGSVEQGSFPQTISPHQPFFDIKSVSYDVVNTGIRARLEVEGDVFEMEDQRNWTDASFKTYCTPQARPKPAAVRIGDRVQQAVTLTLSGKVRPILPVNLGRPPQLSISTTPVVARPPLGLCAASHGRPLTAREIERLKVLRLSHLRVDLKLADPSYPALLEQTAREAAQLGVGLHVALTLSAHADAELRSLAAHLERLKPRVLLWIILHEIENPATEQDVQRARPLLQPHAPGALFAAATRDFFTEINRRRPAAGATSFIGYSNNPQVHAFDNLTMIENLAGQVANVETARTFSPRPVVVSPITLRIRNNAAAAGESPSAPTLPSDVDPRQMSLFGAGWTLASLARLATTGFVHSLTYYETTGWRGVMEGEAGSLLPEQFPSLPGGVFPLYHVFADLAEFPGQQIHPTHSTHPLLVEGLTLADAQGRRRILAANLTGDPQDLKIKTGTVQARVRVLDETNVEEAMRDPETFRAHAGDPRESVSGKIEVPLRPFALACVDIG